MTYTATYSPEDNKLRLYSSSRLDPETYKRVRNAGFIWAPKQELFVAPMWTPAREDLLLELAGEIGDEDTSLVDRAEERAERFSDYSDNRAADAEQARKSVHAIADHIPLGQPILVGHHSEKHARRDAEKIENGMRRAVRMWEQSKYWTDRAKGAIRHAKYKELPAVRARRIKGLEADLRKQSKNKQEAEMWLQLWTKCAAETDSEKQNVVALQIAGMCNLSLPRKQGDKEDFPHPPTAYGALKNDYPNLYAPRTLQDVFDAAQATYPRYIAHCERWISHYENRLAYERAMLEDSGGIASDRTKPEVGGAVRCWSSPGYGKGWAYIVKVNKVSVTIQEKVNYGDRIYSSKMPFDKLTAVMSKADVEAARAEGRITETESKTGFYLHTEEAIAETQPIPEPEPDQFEQMRETLKAGVKAVSAPQLFPTPPDIARMMADRAGQMAGMRVLEPSAGTGNLIRAIMNNATGFDCVRVVAVEHNQQLVSLLVQQRQKTVYANEENFKIHHVDFLGCNPDHVGLETLGYFDRVLMNPPFQNGEDIRHIKHALTFLKPGGRLVAICAGGPRQERELQPLCDSWEPLPEGTFKESGTNVNTVLLTITS